MRGDQQRTVAHSCGASCCSWGRPISTAGFRWQPARCAADPHHCSSTLQHRFEDCAALLAFLSDTYTDVVADVQTTPEDEVPLQLPGAGAFASDAARHMASC